VTVKGLLAALLLLVVFLQYRLWLAEGGIAEVVRLQEQIRTEEAINAELRARNDELARQVLDLQNGQLVIEQRAREDLGLVREGEEYYQFADESPEADGAE